MTTRPKYLSKNLITIFSPTCRHRLETHSKTLAIRDLENHAKFCGCNLIIKTRQTRKGRKQKLKL